MVVYVKNVIKVSIKMVIKVSINMVIKVSIKMVIKVSINYSTKFNNIRLIREFCFNFRAISKECRY